MRRTSTLAAVAGLSCLAGTRLVHGSSPAVAYAKASMSTLASLPPASAYSPAPPLPGPPSVVLYQYESCPFCNKVRAYLDWRRIPYTVVEVDPLFKAALSFSSAYKKVPIAAVDGAIVTDSTLIIDALEGSLASRGLLPAGSSSPTAAAAAAPWRAWVDATLVKHLTVNIYRSWGESMQTFDYLTQRNFPAWSATAARYIGAAAMTAVAARRRKDLGIGSAEGQERQALMGVLSELQQGMAGQPFLGGAQPSLADVSIFGVIRSIESLPTYSEAIAAHPGAAAWYLRVKAAVGPSMLMHRVSEKA